MKLSQIIGTSQRSRSQSAGHDVAYAYHKSSNANAQAFVIIFTRSGMDKAQLEIGDRADIFIDDDEVAIHLCPDGDYGISVRGNSARIQISSRGAADKLKSVFPEKNSRAPLETVSISPKTLKLRIFK